MNLTQFQTRLREAFKIEDALTKGTEIHKLFEEWYKTHKRPPRMVS